MTTRRQFLTGAAGLAALPIIGPLADRLTPTVNVQSEPPPPSVDESQPTATRATWWDQNAEMLAERDRQRIAATVELHIKHAATIATWVRDWERVSDDYVRSQLATIPDDAEIEQREDESWIDWLERREHWGVLRELLTRRLTLPLGWLTHELRLVDDAFLTISIDAAHEMEWRSAEDVDIDGSVLLYPSDEDCFRALTGSAATIGPLLVEFCRQMSLPVPDEYRDVTADVPMTVQAIA